VTKLWAGQSRNWDLIPGSDKSYFLLHSNETGAGAQPSSCPVGMGGFISTSDTEVKNV